MRKPNSEVEPGKNETITLDRFDVSGQLWFRRRYQIPKKPTYSFVQWMDGKAARLKEKPTSIKISDICARIETMDEALRCIQKDVSEVKELIKKTTPLWWVQIWHRLRSLRNLSKNRLQQLLPLLVTWPV